MNHNVSMLSAIKFGDAKIYESHAVIDADSYKTAIDNIESRLSDMNTRYVTTGTDCVSAINDIISYFGG